MIASEGVFDRWSQLSIFAQPTHYRRHIVHSGVRFLGEEQEAVDLSDLSVSCVFGLNLQRVTFSLIPPPGNTCDCICAPQ